MIEQKIILEDDAKEPMSLMIEHRVPWLAIGLIGGIAATLLSSTFASVLEKDIYLAFFIPIIVYMADAMGHQTENVYVRNLTKKRVHISIYLFKEFILGSTLGILFGGITGIFGYFYFKSAQTAITVFLAMAITMSLAPIVALLIPTLLWKEHKDPAVGSGPFATVIQDLISLVTYFFIASAIVFS